MRYQILVLVFLITGITAEAQIFSGKNHKKDYYVYMDTGFMKEPTDRGAWLKASYENDSLKKIEAWYGFNFGDLRRDFYYWNDKLILVLETQRLYNNSASNTINADSVKPNYEGRYVFENDSIKNIKQTGHFSFMDTPADKDSMEKTFLIMSGDYRGILDKARANKKNRIKMKNK